MGKGARKEFCCDAAYEGIGCTCSSTFNSRKFKPGTIIGHINKEKYTALREFSLNYLSEVLAWDDRFVKLRSFQLPNAEKLINITEAYRTETYDLHNLISVHKDILNRMDIIDCLNTKNYHQKYKVGNIVVGGESWQLQKNYIGKIGKIISINDNGSEMEILWFRPFDFYKEVYLEASKKDELDKINKTDRWKKWTPYETTKVKAKVKCTLIPFIVVLESDLFPESICEGQLYHPLSSPGEDMVEILEVDKDRQWIRVKSQSFSDGSQMYLSYFDFGYREGYVFHSNGHLDTDDWWFNKDAEAYVEDDYDDYDFDCPEEPW